MKHIKRFLYGLAFVVPVVLIALGMAYFPTVMWFLFAALFTYGLGTLIKFHLDNPEKDKPDRSNWV